MTTIYEISALHAVVFCNTTIPAFRRLCKDAQLQMLAEVKKLLTNSAIKPHQKNQLAAQLSLLTLDEGLEQQIRSAALTILENWENPL